jgi:hypothetical protein
MLGFELTFWDYATFASLALAGAIGVGSLIWLAGLPGRIAIARNHPEAEAVQWLGYAGLLPTVVPWVQAFIWAFKPTEIVDIRRFPAAEAKATEREIAKLQGKEVADYSLADDVGETPLDALQESASPTKPKGPTE